MVQLYLKTHKINQAQAQSELSQLKFGGIRILDCIKDYGFTSRGFQGEKLNFKNTFIPGFLET